MVSALLTVSALVLPNTASAWGQNGHRIVGQIADNHLTDKTKAAILPLLEGDKLPEVTTWADEMRSNPGHFWKKESGRWHYITVEKPTDFKPDTYTPSHKHDVKDAYHGIISAIAVLQSKDASLDEKRFFFRFLTHLIGDIHQPLHVGRRDDRGGNRIKVQFFGNNTNLHSLWDTGLIENQKLSFTEFADFIDTQNPELIAEYVSSAPKAWIMESYHLVQNVYKVGEEPDFRYHYVYEQTPIVKTRLLQAGIRLAGVLNAIFDDNAKTKVALAHSHQNVTNNN